MRLLTSILDATLDATPRIDERLFKAIEVDNKLRRLEGGAGSCANIPPSEVAVPAQPTVYPIEEPTVPLLQSQTYYARCSLVKATSRRTDDQTRGTHALDRSNPSFCLLVSETRWTGWSQRGRVRRVAGVSCGRGYDRCRGSISGQSGSKARKGDYILEVLKGILHPVPG